MHRRIIATLLCIVMLSSCLSGWCTAANTVTQMQVEEQLAQLVEMYEGQTYTDSFYGATQCKGFADMIYDLLFQVGIIGVYPNGVYHYMDLYGAHTKEVGRIEPGYETDGTQTIQALLSQAKPGDYIQMQRRSKGYGHSMIVVDVTDRGIEVLHSNWYGNYVNSVNFFTWQQMTNISDGISLYHYQNYLGSGEFTDVPQNAWYYDDVQFVFQQELMYGISDTAFWPNGQMDRAMLVTVLYRLSHDGGTYANQFADVPAESWYTNSVGWAQTYGITSGYPDGAFHPKDSVTREQIATFLYRFAEFEGKVTDTQGDLSVFSDINQLSAFAVTPMEWAVGAGIFSGSTDGGLHPKANATRAEVAAILTRYVQQFRTVE